MADELSQKQYMFLFRRDIDHYIDLDRGDRLLQKHSSQLEQIRATEPEYFWQDLCKSNFLTYVYCKKNQLNEALQQNEETLKRDAKNLNALTNKIVIACRQKNLDLRAEAVKCLEDVEKDGCTMSMQCLVAKAEVAMVYSYLGPAAYYDEMLRLEQVLRDVERDTSLQSRLNIHLPIWKWHLAQAYNRVMNKGNIVLYKNRIYDELTYTKLYQKSKKLYAELIDAQHATYAGKAWVDLADAYKKYEEATPISERMEDLPNNMTADDCFLKARETAPEDPYVLERCGRHHRQRASTLKEFKDAVELLELAVECDSTRHIAYHHMGLAYRSMWLDNERHEEAKLHSNKARKGSKKCFKKKSARHSTSDSSNSDRLDVNMSSVDIHENAGTRFERSTSDVFSHNANFSEDMDANAAVPFERSTSEVLEINKKYIMSKQTISKGMPRSLSVPSTTHQEVIPKKRYDPPGKMPRPERKPDYFDNLRVSNPRAANPKNEYLMKARDCFEKANKLTNETCCRYLVDLGRTCISMGDVEVARQCFKMAESTDFLDNDGAYLYEQWAVLNKHRSKTCLEVTSDVEALCRKSITCSVAAGLRSRIAFYLLRNIVLEKLDKQPDDIALKKEYSLLFSMVEHYKKAEEILTIFLKDDENVELTWELVDVLVKRNQRGDADTALMYITGLAEAGCLTTDSFSDQRSLAILDASTVLSHQHLLFEVAFQYAEANLHRSQRSISNILSRAFKWLYRWRYPATNVNSQATNCLQDEGIPKFVPVCICIVAPSDRTQGVKPILEVLRDVCGLHVRRGFLDDESPSYNDIRPGAIVVDAIIDMVKRSAALVLVDDKDLQARVPFDATVGAIGSDNLRCACQVVVVDDIDLEPEPTVGHSGLSTIPICAIELVDQKDPSHASCQLQQAKTLMKKLLFESIKDVDASDNCQMLTSNTA